MSTKKYVNKTRVLQPDLGRDGDDLYFARSGFGYFGSMTPETVRNIHSTWYQSGRNQRNASTDFSSWPYGSEQLRGAVGGYGTMNNCIHVRQRAVQYPVTAIHNEYRPWTTGSYYELFWRHAPAMGYVSTASSTAIQLGGAHNDSGFSARAYWSMRPKFQSDSALLNSMFELKDFSDLASSFTTNLSPSGVRSNLKKARRNIRNFRRGPKDFVKPFVDKTVTWLTHPSHIISDLAQIAATAQLTYALAIMPTIRDVAGIHANAVKSVRALGAEFKRMGEEGARSHYTENAVHTNTLVAGGGNMYYLANGAYVHKKVTATMVSRYQVLWKKFEDLYPYWWGLEMGVDEIWNMLPLSFLLDYILTIGKSLEYMDVDKNVNVLSTEYCESVKVQADYGSFILYDTNVPLLGIDGELQQPPSSKQKPLLVTGTQGIYYQRRVMEPYKGPALPQLRLPSTRQTANIAALAKCILF